MKDWKQAPRIEGSEFAHIPIGEEVPPNLLRWFPDFLIAGPQRTGTTWLHKILEHHPQVLAPVRKELFFFTQRTNKEREEDDVPADLAAYVAHFRYPPRLFWHRWRRMWRLYREPFWPRVRGEATATYAAMPEEAIAEILRINPHLKVILMLRDPVERGWSHAKKTLARKAGGVEKVSDEEFLRYFGAGYQRRCGMATELIETWRRHLKPGHLFLGFFEELTENPENLLLDLYQFLGVRADPKYTRTHLRDRVNATGSSQVPEKFRGELEKIFEEERKRLAQLREKVRREGRVI